MRSKRSNCNIWTTEGVEPEDVSRLDYGLRHFAEKIYEVTGKEFAIRRRRSAGNGAGIAAILGEADEWN